MVSVIDRVQGYAAVYGELSSPLDDGLREIIAHGAFGRMVIDNIYANVDHTSAKFATAWNRGLRLWADGRGLAFEIDVEGTLLGAGVRNMVASGLGGMSVGLIILASDVRDRVRTVSRATVDHVTICERGAYPGACCWLASAPAWSRPTAARQWRLGKIANEQRRKADREAVAKMLAAAAPRAKAHARGGKPLFDIASFLAQLPERQRGAMRRV